MVTTLLLFSSLIIESLAMQTMRQRIGSAIMGKVPDIDCTIAKKQQEITKANQHLEAEKELYAVLKRDLDDGNKNRDLFLEGLKQKEKEKDDQIKLHMAKEQEKALELAETQRVLESAEIKSDGQKKDITKLKADLQKTESDLQVQKEMLQKKQEKLDKERQKSTHFESKLEEARADLGELRKEAGIMMETHKQIESELRADKSTLNGQLEAEKEIVQKLQEKLYQEKLDHDNVLDEEKTKFENEMNEKQNEFQQAIDEKNQSIQMLKESAVLQHDKFNNKTLEAAGFEEKLEDMQSEMDKMETKHGLFTSKGNVRLVLSTNAALMIVGCTVVFVAISIIAVIVCICNRCNKKVKPHDSANWLHQVRISEPKDIVTNVTVAKSPMNKCEGVVKMDDEVPMKRESVCDDHSEEEKCDEVMDIGHETPGFAVLPDSIYADETVGRGL